MRKWIFCTCLMIGGLYLQACSPKTSRPPTIEQSTLAEFEFIWPDATNPQAAKKAMDLRKQADDFAWLNEVDRAISTFKEIKELVDTAYPNDPGLLAAAANDYGTVLNLAGRNDTALPWHEKALSLNEQSNKTSLHYLDRKMRILANLGETHIRLNNIKKAKNYYAQSFAVKPVFRSAQPFQTTTRERTMMLVANWRTEYVDTPEVMFIKTDYVPDSDGHKKAMENYDATLKALPSGESKLIEDAFTAYFNQMLKAHHPRSRYVYSAYGNKSLISSLFLNGKWIDEFLAKSVASAPKYGLETEADQKNILGGVLNASDIYIRRGQLEKAERLLDIVNEQLIQKQTHPNSWHVIYNNNRSELYMQKGKPERSLFFARKAFDLSARINIQASTGHQIDHLNLARRLALAGYNAEALDEFQSLLSTLEETSKTQSNVYVLAQNGYAHELFAQGRAPDAFEIFTDIIKRTNNINAGVNRDHVNALVGAASTLNYLGRNENAVIYIEKALKIAPKVYDKAGLFQLSLDQVHIRILAGNGHIEEALNLSAEIYNTRLKGDADIRMKNGILSDQISFHLSLGQTTNALTLVQSMNDDIDKKNIDRNQPLYKLAAVRQNYLKAKLQENTNSIELLEDIWPLYLKTVNSESRHIYAEAGASADDHMTRNIFGDTMMLAYYVGAKDKAFEIAQQLLTNKASRASETVLQRESIGSRTLRRRLQNRNVAAEKLRVLENTYVQSFGGTKTDIQKAKKSRGDAKNKLEKLDEGLSAYINTANINGLPKPMQIKSVQKTLRQNQAVLMIAQTNYETLVFAITASDFKTVRSQLSPQELEKLVRQVRISIIDKSTFDYDAAHQVYSAIFMPEIQSIMSEVTSIKVLANKSLSTLPFSVLTSGTTANDFLVNTYAFSTLPGLSAIKAQTNKKNGGNKRQGFVGIGAPKLGNTPNTALSTTTNTPLTTGQSAYFLRAASDISQLKMLPDLPNAEMELREIAAALAADRTHFLLGADATEKAVRAFDFSNQGIVVFATHGLIAGELALGSEPALVMTPIGDDGSNVSGPNNNGLLSQSEILEMNMDVNWVILSACNSAAGASKSAPGLTGIASAFLYAGADSLLVSHWLVRDDAAAFLTINTVQNTKSGMDKAEALQKATLDLMGSNIPGASNPSVWAPFVLVGG